MMAVLVKAAAGAPPSFEPGAPVALFDAHLVHNANDSQFQYDVTKGRHVFFAQHGRGAVRDVPTATERG
jgi:hypothetical protein